MDNGFEDRLPSEHAYFEALNQASISPRKPDDDYLWLEKFIPYSESAPFHWFLRFDRL